MPSNKKNIIIILIDALRFDRLKSGGYKYNLTPNLNKIIKDGSLVKNHFANGCPTSVSFPSIFTSTYPLDYSGYNDGIKNRPKTFFSYLIKSEKRFVLTWTHTPTEHEYNEERRRRE